MKISINEQNIKMLIVLGIVLSLGAFSQAYSDYRYFESSLHDAVESGLPIKAGDKFYFVIDHVPSNPYSNFTINEDYRLP